MEIDGELRIFDAEDVPGRELDISDGRISLERLRSSFVFEGIQEVQVVDGRRWWPRGSLIAIRFVDLSQCLQAAPQLTSSDLRVLACVHQIEVPARCAKAAIIELLTGHSCIGTRSGDTAQYSIQHACWRRSHFG